MNKILVPTDFSTGSQFALNTAISIGKKTAAELVLFHSSIPNEGVNNNVYSAIFIHEYHTVKIENLENLAASIRDQGYPGTITTDHQIGYIVSSILESSKRHQADLIVMGSTGSGFLEGMLIGSSSGGVLSKSDIPVLIVPKNFSINATHNTLLIGTDFKTHLNPRSIATIDFLRNQFSYKVILAHMDDEINNDERSQYITKNFITPPDEVLILQGEAILETLKDLYQSYPNPVLCTVRKHRNWLESIFSKSISKSLAQNADMALLCLQD